MQMIESESGTFQVQFKQPMKHISEANGKVEDIPGIFPSQPTFL